jgi:hypothetical protein
MYRILFLFLILYNTMILSADDSCYFNLLGGSWGDSFKHTLSRDELYPLNVDSLKRAVATILDRSKCNAPLKDKEILGCFHILNTDICRVNYKYGYFIIFPDGAESYNIVFNRWD